MALLRAGTAAVMQRVLQARTDFAAFHEFVWYTPTGDAVSVQPFHREWIKLMDEERWFLLLASRNSGKCHAEGSTILGADGRRVPIERWTGGRVLAYDTETYELVPAASSKAIYNGVRHCLHIRTRTGREEVVTENHKFATIVGWVQAKDLRPGMRIAVPRRLTCPDAGKNNMSSDEAWLLGLFVGDGSACSGHAGISKPDKRVQNHVIRIARARGWRVTVFAGDNLEFVSEDQAQEPPRAWLRRHELFGHNAYEKRVPPDVFAASDAGIAEFLAGYFDADGTIDARGGHSIEYDSVSEDLLHDVQHLLTRLGIVSVLRRKRGRYKGAVHWSWRLAMNGENVLHFAAAVTLRGEKRATLTEAVRKECTRNFKSKVDALPQEIYAWLPKSRGWCTWHGLPGYDPAYEMSRRKAALFASALDVPRLQRLVDADIVWDQVVVVESAGRRRTWGIEVPVHHSYVGQDIISHNTETLSSRVVWELGRNPELRVKYACQSDKRAKTVLRSIKAHLTKNPLLPVVFPHLKRAQDGVWTDTQIEIVRKGAGRDPSVDALGIMSTVVGGRSDILIADDVVDYRTAILQPKMRDAVNAKFFSDWVPTLEPDGRCWIVMTPRSHKDLAAKIQEELKGWKVHWTPTGTDEDPCLPLWPERFPRELLEHIRNNIIGPIDYDREYRLKITSDDIAPVRPCWVRYYDADLLGNPDDLLCIVSFDLAISQAASADYFAWCVLLYDHTRNLTFVVDAGRDRLTFLDQAQKVIQLAQTWNADRVVIEKANYEGALAQYVEELATSPIPVVTVKPKVKKDRRVLDVTPLLESARVWFHPKLNPKTNPNLPYTGDFISEMLDFPVGKHDDMLDAFTTGMTSLRDFAGAPGDGAGLGGQIGATILGS